MNIKKHIPNILTLANLFCGILAIKVGFSEYYYLAGFFVIFGAIFDFFDGFAARLLKVQGELGKQLDSLADMVTFGVAPGVVMYSFLYDFIQYEYAVDSCLLGKYVPFEYEVIPYVALLIPLLSAIRLAKFNIDTNQTDKFIGLPTPANAMFFIFLPIIVLVESSGSIYSHDVIDVLENSPESFHWYNKFIVIGLILLFSYLLNAPIEMIALKFKTFGWKGNEIRFIFLGLCLVVILLSLLISSVFVSVPIIILLYIILSVINNLFKKKQNELQS